MFNLNKLSGLPRAITAGKSVWTLSLRDSIPRPLVDQCQGAPSRNFPLENSAWELQLECLSTRQSGGAHSGCDSLVLHPGVHCEVSAISFTLGGSECALSMEI